MNHALKWMAIIAGLVHAFHFSLEPKVTLEHYEEIVAARKQSSERYSFLPSQVSDTAETTAFHHVPGYLQGNDMISLRQTLPRVEIESLLKELEQSGRTEISDFGDLPAPHCYPEYESSKELRDGSVEGPDKLPPGFRIFLFETDLDDLKKNPNHNFLAFTAVSVAKREVVYHADRW